MSKALGHENHIERLIKSGMFEVHEDGSVFKHYRKGSNGKKQFFAEPKRICSKDHRGTQFVEVTIKGKMVRCSIARIIWRHFKGKIAKGMRVHHKDGDRSNNALKNLELGK